MAVEPRCPKCDSVNLQPTNFPDGGKAWGCDDCGHRSTLAAAYIPAQ